MQDIDEKGTMAIRIMCVIIAFYENTHSSSWDIMSHENDVDIESLRCTKSSMEKFVVHRLEFQIYYNLIFQDSYLINELSINHMDQLDSNFSEWRAWIVNNIFDGAYRSERNKRGHEEIKWRCYW